MCSPVGKNNTLIVELDEEMDGSWTVGCRVAKVEIVAGHITKLPQSVDRIVDTF